MRGSSWGRWDLHVHSPASVLCNRFNGTGEEKWSLYMEKLRSLKDFVALGITDYFSIDGYKRVIAEGGLANIPLLLPCVELRLRPVTDQGTALNLHAIFNPDILTDIEEKFFPNLEFKYNNEPYTCTRPSLVRLGQSIENNNELSESIAYRKGVSQFNVDIDGFKKVFDNSHVLRNNTIIVVSNRSGDGASGLREDALAATRQEIYRLSDAIFSSNVKDREYFLGRGTDTIEDLLQKCGSPMPCIHGSDAHSLQEIGHPCAKRGAKDHVCSEQPEDCELRYCWIKAEPTFEGLRQILFEPETRVHIGPRQPPMPLHRIGKVSLSFPPGSQVEHEPFCYVGEHTFQFSPFLNCIIGGRGTGKSTLLNLISEKLTPDSTAFDPLKKLSIPDGTAVSECVTIDSDDEEKYVEFISQNQIHAFALDAKKLTTALLQRVKKLDSTGRLDQMLSDVNGAVEATKQQVENLWQLKELRMLMQSKQAELQSTQNILNSFKSAEYSSLVKAEQALINTISMISSSRDKYEELLGQLKQIQASIDVLTVPEGESIDQTPFEYERAYRDVISSIRQIITDTESLDFATVKQFERDRDKELEMTRSQLSAFLTSHGLSKENLADMTSASASIAAFRTEIARVNKDIEKLQTKVAQFDEKVLTGAKATYVKELTRQIEDLAMEPVADDSDVKAIGLEVSYDSAQAEEDLRTAFQNRFPSVKERRDFVETRLFTVKPSHVDRKGNLLNAIRNGGDQLNKTQTQLVEVLSDDDNFAVYKLMAQSAVCDVATYCRINVLYDNKQLVDSSFGQRCTAVIVLLLSIGNNPLIIDEPEAHLDSSLIANYLVPLLKTAKLGRQIIFATHNANFVVNGDAELIYSLEMKNQRTVALPMTVEDINNRDRLLSLEGGREAFLRRGDKYGA